MRKYTEDEKFMKEAIKQAKKAEAIGDVPIGCVIVHDGKIIARGYNKRNKDKTVLAHAELLAMKKACKKLGDWRLEDCTMYITLEPCQMCAGAIVQARVTRVVIGSMNAKAGCGGSILNLLEMQEFNHQAEVERGVLQEECSEMLSAFFRKLREIQKEKKKKRKLIQEKNQTDRRFDLRISSATVDLEASDFTLLPDYQRIITPLELELKCSTKLVARLALCFFYKIVSLKRIISKVLGD